MLTTSRWSDALEHAPGRSVSDLIRAGPSSYLRSWWLSLGWSAQSTAITHTLKTKSCGSAAPCAASPPPCFVQAGRVALQDAISLAMPRNPPIAPTARPIAAAALLAVFGWSGHLVLRSHWYVASCTRRGDGLPSLSCSDLQLTPGGLEGFLKPFANF